MSKTPEKNKVSEAGANYALDLYEKGFSVPELARILHVSHEEMWQAIREAEARR